MLSLQRPFPNQAREHVRADQYGGQVQQTHSSHETGGPHTSPAATFTRADQGSSDLYKIFFIDESRRWNLIIGAAPSSGVRLAETGGKMFQVVLTIGGVILGILLTAGYQNVMDRRGAKQLRIMLAHEIARTRSRLAGIVKLLDAFPANELPSYIKPMNIEEIAQRVEGTCDRKLFEACITSRGFGRELKEQTLRFYARCEETARTFRETERWAGNIRAGLFHDYINALVSDAEALEVRLTA